MNGVRGPTATLRRTLAAGVGRTRMKAIQFTIDEGLLRRIDRLPEVKQRGRSAFLRSAVEDYLARKHARQAREAYRRGYQESPPRPDEFGPFAVAFGRR